ncbi:uncharacterized protein V6R79_012588 [Siganus canaliculatus]
MKKKGTGTQVWPSEKQRLRSLQGDVWTWSRSREWSVDCDPSSFNDTEFIHNFRMSRKKFESICQRRSEPRLQTEKDET